MRIFIEDTILGGKNSETKREIQPIVIIAKAIVMVSLLVAQWTCTDKIMSRTTLKVK